MQKEEALKKTRIMFWVQTIAAIALVAIFESNLINNTDIAVTHPARYPIEVAGIMLTICIIPLAVKGFSTQVSKAAKNRIPHFIEYYHSKCNARTSLLFMVIMANIALYYLLGNNSGALYCGLLGVAAAIYSYPTKTTLDNYCNIQEE